jgi:hypothetical protein
VKALAVIHWSTNVDAYDVEFVLGSEGDITYTQYVSVSLGLTAAQVAQVPSHTNFEAMMSVNFKRRTTRVWVLDFNRCNRLEESVGYENPEELITHLVLAFFENDPSYLRPMMGPGIEQELWVAFSSKYLDRAAEILSAPGKDPRLAQAGLPQMFIDACVLRQVKDLA